MVRNIFKRDKKLANLIPNPNPNQKLLLSVRSKVYEQFARAKYQTKSAIKI